MISPVLPSFIFFISSKNPSTNSSNIYLLDSSHNSETIVCNPCNALIKSNSLIDCPKLSPQSEVHHRTIILKYPQINYHPFIFNKNDVNSHIKQFSSNQVDYSLKLGFCSAYKSLVRSLKSSMVYGILLIGLLFCFYLLIFLSQRI